MLWQAQDPAKEEPRCEGRGGREPQDAQANPKPQPQTRNLKPQTSNPNPPKPRNPNLKLETPTMSPNLNPKLETTTLSPNLNPKLDKLAPKKITVECQSAACACGALRRKRNAADTSPFKKEI